MTKQKNKLEKCVLRGAVRVLCVALALSMGVGVTPIAVRRAYALTSTDGSIVNWNGAKQGDSYVFTLETNGSTNAAGDKTFQVTYADGAQGNSNAFKTTWDAGQVKGGWYQDIAGAAVSASGNTVTITIPASYFANDDFTVSFGGSSITSAEMAGGSGAAAPEPAPGTGSGSPDGGNAGSGSGEGESGESGNAGTGSGEATPDAPSGDNAGSSDANNAGTAAGGKSGIVIDGDFSDWDNIKKYDVDESGWHSWGNNVDEVAMVWDGDWVYLYFCSYGTPTGWSDASQGIWDSVTGAGPSSNGQFSIKTDLGKETLVQLKNVNGEPTVSGVDGAKAAVNNKDYFGAPHKWEVAIPASALKDYKETINFGFYQVDPIIKNVADLQGSKGGDFNGITYDGKYDDWRYYPHTTIEYATSGTQENVVDSEGALYADSEQQKLFGHVVTTMPEHLEEAGGEFTQAVSIRINGDDDLMLTPRFIAVDEDGNINWNPQLSGLADGTYEFYLTSTTVDGTSKNINDLKADDVIYGKATVTISEGKDEMEWEMDIPTLAANLHKGWGQSKDTVSIDPNDIKEFASQYGRLGQQWVTTAGTSTGAAVGIVLCVATVAGVYLYRRRKDGSAPVAPATPVTTV